MDTTHTILIATTNKDKFNFIREVLINFGFNDSEFLMLCNIRFHGEIAESGSIQNRSLQKVDAARAFLGNFCDKRRVDLVVGVDDGIFINQTGKLYTNTHFITKKIVEGNFLRKDSVVSIHHAFCFYITKTDEYFNSTTFSLFKYIGSIKQIEFKLGEYPLKYVLAYMDQTIPVFKNSNQEITNRNIQFSEKKIKPIIKKIIGRLNNQK